MDRSPPIAFGPFSLDPTTSYVWRGTQRLTLRQQAVAVLHHLAARPRTPDLGRRTPPAPLAGDPCQQHGPAGVYPGDSGGPGGYGDGAAVY